MDDTKIVKPDNLIIEFLEVSIHQLLYVHEIYPSGIFTQKQKYGVPVQVSGHPLVNNYITQCLLTAQELLKQRTLDSVMLVFCISDNQLVRKIVFDISSLQRGITIQRDNLAELDRALRDLFLRVSLSDRHLSPLPTGCTFKILLCTQEQGHVNISNGTNVLTNQDFPWAKCNEHRVENMNIVPISSLDCCGLQLQVYVENQSSSNIAAGLSTPKVS